MEVLLFVAVTGVFFSFEDDHGAGCGRAIGAGVARAPGSCAADAEPFAAAAFAFLGRDWARDGVGGQRVAVIQPRTAGTCLGGPWWLRTLARVRGGAAVVGTVRGVRALGLAAAAGALFLLVGLGFPV